MAGIVAEGLGDTVDHGVDPAGTGHAADVDLQARLAARMEAVGTGHRAQQAVAVLAFGHRQALATDSGCEAIVGGRHVLAGSAARCIAVRGVALHTQRAGAAAAVAAFGRRRLQGGAACMDEARTQAAAGQQVRQGLRIVEVAAQRARHDRREAPRRRPDRYRSAGCRHPVRQAVAGRAGHSCAWRPVHGHWSAAVGQCRRRPATGQGQGAGAQHRGSRG